MFVLPNMKMLEKNYIFKLKLFQIFRPQQNYKIVCNLFDYLNNRKIFQYFTSFNRIEVKKSTLFLPWWYMIDNIYLSDFGAVFGLLFDFLLINKDNVLFFLIKINLT